MLAGARVFARRATWLSALLRPLGVRWAEWVLNMDPGVLLAIVEVLRIEHSAAHLSRAADDLIRQQVSGLSIRSTI
jgi:hypothetical protein